MADINSLHICTTLRYFHTWSHTNCSKTSRDYVSSTKPQGGYGKSHSFVTGLENTLFTDPISEGSGRNLAQFFHSLGDKKTQTERSCCADRCTNWPSSQQQISLAPSTSNNSSWPQQRSIKTSASLWSRAQRDRKNKQEYTDVLK